MEALLSVFFVTTIIIFLTIIYFVPSLIAVKRNHRYKLWIFALNFLTGFSGLGWIASFVWAFIDNEIPPISQMKLPMPESSITREIKELARLKEDGLITEEEFNNRKNKILNES